MTTFAIYRCTKIKTLGALRGSAAHTARARITPNADGSLAHLNEQVLGFCGRIPSPSQLVEEWQRLAASGKRKQDAVLAQELFLGTSPEFFTDCTPVERSERLLKWKSRAVKWLQEQFRDLCFSATLHLDETTPHIVAYVVPLRRAKDGTLWLSAKKIFNPNSLRRQQDSYAAAMADIGLRRGIRGSVAKHTEVSAFYGALAQPSASTQLDTAARAAPLLIPAKKLLENSHEYSTKVRQAVDQHVGAIRSAAKGIATMSSAAEISRRKVKELSTTNEVLSQRITVAEEELKAVVGKLRDIPLSQILERLGFGPGVKTESGLMWDSGDHLITVSDQSWVDTKATGKGRKAIDLVRHVMECTYVDAVAWLAGQWPPEEAAAAIRAAAEDQVHDTPKLQVAEVFACPDPVATRSATTLLRERYSLSENLLGQLAKEGRWHGSFQNRMGNPPRLWCVFNHTAANNRSVGSSLVSVDGPALVSRTIGNREDGCFRIGPAPNNDSPVALVEDPISALCYAQIFPASHVVSVAGDRIPEQLLNVIGGLPSKLTVAFNDARTREREWAALIRQLRGVVGNPDLLSRILRGSPLNLGIAGASWAEVLRRTIAAKDQSFARSMGLDSPLRHLAMTPSLQSPGGIAL